mmetsp:Transcript_41059/g.95890  ORF Transcript_41059/g.95890 Transcript_41059/m.95890 type:complete len:143 (+) Transcript_41059:494-922(+)
MTACRSFAAPSASRAGRVLRLQRFLDDETTPREGSRKVHMSTHAVGKSWHGCSAASTSAAQLFVQFGSMRAFLPWLSTLPWLGGVDGEAGSLPSFPELLILKAFERLLGESPPGRGYLPGVRQASPLASSWSEPPASQHKFT